MPSRRHVRMPITKSFPSGPAAYAFPFATGVASASPEAGMPLSVLATVVAYSRLHTGGHYRIDAIAGSVTGAALAPIAVAAVERCRTRRSNG